MVYCLCKTDESLLEKAVTEYQNDVKISTFVVKEEGSRENKSRGLCF